MGLFLNVRDNYMFFYLYNSTLIYIWYNGNVYNRMERDMGNDYNKREHLVSNMGNAYNMAKIK